VRARSTTARRLLRGPLLGLHVLLVLVLVGTGVAGGWQWQAWRSAQRNDAAERMTRDPVPLTEALGPDEPLANEDDGVAVDVAGTYAPRADQFLVSGRTLAGEAGYWVLSPLVVAGTKPPAAVLVARGWTSQRTLPAVPADEVRETGVLAAGEEGSGTVGADRVVASVRLPALVGEVDTDLFGGYLVRTTRPAPPGLAAIEPPTADPSWSVGLRNLAYALQWWLFGAFGLFMWWRICRDQVSTIA